MARHIRPITTLLKPQQKSSFALSLRNSQPHRSLTFPDWDAMIIKSRLLRLLCDASIDVLGATLEKKVLDGSIRLIYYIIRATLRQQTELDFYSTRSGMRRVNYPTSSPLFIQRVLPNVREHECLQQTSKIGKSKPRIKRWTEFFPDYNYRPSYRRGRGNANANFLRRLPFPSTVEDISGSCTLSDPDDLGDCVLRACDYIAPPCPISDVDLGELAPSSYPTTYTGLDELFP